MADVDVDIWEFKLRELPRDRRMAKELLKTAKSVGLEAYNIAPKRHPLHEYAASIREEIEIGPFGDPVAYVSADTDAIKIEYGTEDTPAFRPLGKALEAKRIS
ncbi:hypothetical protein GCM10010149_47510 [Nonomuraea roseoviolacea subsp. roseoviolacea]|uniref:hypothetical protein n=1 Tax=Nonomuraea roseoviolacea TaxID=103837 RepID=UPI0031D462A1